MAVAKKSAPSHKAPSTLYERDFHEWLTTQAAALREGNLRALDTENLAEEIEDMARNEKRAAKSQLARLLAHLLKWSVQRELRRKNPRSANSWRGSIAGARDELSERLADSPSLRRHLVEVYSSVYVRAINGLWKRLVFLKALFRISVPGPSRRF